MKKLCFLICAALALVACNDEPPKSLSAEYRLDPVEIVLAPTVGGERMVELERIALEYAAWIRDNERLPTIDPVGLSIRLDHFGVERESQVGYLGLGPIDQLVDRNPTHIGTHYGAARAGDFAVLILVDAIDTAPPTTNN